MRRTHQLVTLLFLGVASAACHAAENEPPLSLSINEFTRRALTNSLRIKSAQESFASSRWAWLATHRNLTWPTLSASAARTKSYSDDDAGSSIDTNEDEAQLSLKQPLLLTGTDLFVNSNWSRLRQEVDAFGATTASTDRQLPAWEASFRQPLFVFIGNPAVRSRRVADLQMHTNEESYVGEQLSLEFDARTIYYNLLLQQETTFVQQKKFESAKLINDVTRALVAAGKLAEVELVRADIRSKQDQRSIQNAESAMTKAINNATDLISLPSNQPIQLTSKLIYVPFTTPLPALVKAMEKNNPSLKIARHQIELSEISLREGKEGNRPEISATGSYALTRDRSDRTRPLDPYNWSLRLGVDWFLFDATQSRLLTRQRELALSAAKREYENKLRQLRVSVENAYLEIKRTEEQILDFGTQKESAERNLKAIRLQYKNGLTRLTDVFDAENQVRDLELEYLDLLVNFNRSRDGLKVLIGIDASDIARGQRP